MNIVLKLNDVEYQNGATITFNVGDSATLSWTTTDATGIVYQLGSLTNTSSEQLELAASGSIVVDTVTTPGSWGLQLTPKNGATFGPPVLVNLIVKGTDAVGLTSFSPLVVHEADTISIGWTRQYPNLGIIAVLLNNGPEHAYRISDFTTATSGTAIIPASEWTAPPASATYNVSLVAIDNSAAHVELSNRSNVIPVEFVVPNTATSVAITSPSTGITIGVGQPVTLVWTSTNTNRITYSVNGVEVPDNIFPFNGSWSFTATQTPGTYLIKLLAYPTTGSPVESNVVTATVVGSSISAPPNDNIVNAQLITLDANGTASIQGTTIGATLETGEGSLVYPGYSSVWYKWTAPANGTVTITVNPT